MLVNTPKYYEASRVFQAHLEAKGIELDDLDTALTDVEAQFFVPTATWGLRYWEEICGLPINEQDALEVRRARILAKLQRFPSARRIDIEKVLNARGFEDSTIEEFWRSILTFPYHNGGTMHSGASFYAELAWAKFKIHLGLSEWKNLTIKEKEEIADLMEEVKPAHLVYTGYDLKLTFTDQVSLVEEMAITGGLIYKIKFTDLFLRPGLRHSGQINYPKALIRDAVVLYNASIRHYQFISDVIIPHRLVGEEIMVAQLVGGPR
jgi:hypothetical protein